jgi:hypothetical protein
MQKKFLEDYQFGLDGQGLWLVWEREKVRAGFDGET